VQPRTLMMIVLAGLVPAAAMAADPVLTVTEPDIDTWVWEGVATAPIAVEVASGADLDFSWLGDASGYGGTILGYRYGWDIVDPDDPDDPGWATPGYVADLLAAPTVVFEFGVHSLHVEVADTDGGLTRAWYSLVIAPPVSAAATSWGGLKAAFRH